MENAINLTDIRPINTMKIRMTGAYAYCRLTKKKINRQTLIYDTPLSESIYLREHRYGNQPIYYIVNSEGLDIGEFSDLKTKQIYEEYKDCIFDVKIDRVQVETYGRTFWILLDIYKPTNEIRSLRDLYKYKFGKDTDMAEKVEEASKIAIAEAMLTPEEIQAKQEAVKRNEAELRQLKRKKAELTRHEKEVWAELQKLKKVNKDKNNFPLNYVLFFTVALTVLASLFGIVLCTETEFLFSGLVCTLGSFTAGGYVFREVNKVKSILVRVNDLENNLNNSMIQNIALQSKYDELKSTYDESQNNITELTKQIKTLTAANKELKQTQSPEHQEVKRLEDKIEYLNNLSLEIKDKNSKLSNETIRLTSEISAKKKELLLQESKLINLEDELLLQEFGLYTPLYSFATADGYKDKLKDIRTSQKSLVRNNTATNYVKDWTVNGDKVAGAKMIKNMIKQIIRTFNIECDNVIDRVKFNNFESMEKRIRKAFDDLNKMNSTCKVSISNQYLQLKIDELHLAYEYQVKKQEEKEERLRLRAEAREDAKVKKEIEEARKNIYKEQKHFQNALKKLEEQMESTEYDTEQYDNLLQKSAAIKKRLNDIDEKLEDLNYRESNQRAGYVYVISNIGAFGENVYKIGMTRRHKPLDRVDELSIASVPFKFDVHAMIFSEDAPKLESALHKAFDDKKLNMVNKRKEFFNVTLEEIEAVVKAHFDKTVEFTTTPPAEEYRASLKMRKIPQNNYKLTKKHNFEKN